MIEAMSGERMCFICQDDLGSDPVMALLCGHVFHTECISTYASTKGLPIERIKCPTCRVVSGEVGCLTLTFTLKPLGS